MLQETTTTIPLKHFNIKITGKVQGVFFRDTARQVAGSLGVAGYAANQPDGSIFIEAEGEEPVVDKFLQWCHQGPTWARVDGVEAEPGEIQGFTKFRARY